ncbi:MAG TPA: hypothetical protein VF744_02195 [Beijerinckiaceae bacterium]
MAVVVLSDSGRLPAGLGPALAAPAAAAERAKAASRPERAKKATWDEAEDGRPRFAKPSAYTAAFSLAPYDRPHVRGSFVRNPLVSAQYRSTPEYEYLYTPAPVHASPPAPASYRYAADTAYLLRPSLGRGAVAVAYRWRRCMDAPAPSVRTASARPEPANRPAVGRERGQKIDNALTPSAVLAGDPGWRAAGRDLGLGEDFRPPAWGASGSHRPCLTGR